ncbi:MAG: hypothetical protein IT184_11530 [Acidobacteria bacterium]|nr:hypothetical protein [Acidobacteriota bacterium]
MSPRGEATAGVSSSRTASTVAQLWYFMASRANHEKTIAQLKTGLAFHTGLARAA